MSTGTRASKFYQSTTDSALGWGTTVRKADEGYTSSGPDTSTLVFGTGTANATKTVAPFTTAAAGAVGSDYGWALDPTGTTGMNSTSTVKRKTLAGTWSFRATINVPAPGAVTGNITCVPTWVVFRVGASPTFTRTLLFSSSAASQSATVLTGATDLIFTSTSAAQPEYIFEPGETLHVGIQVTSQQTAGLAGAVVANTQTYRIGTGTYTQLPSPGIVDLFIAAYTGATTPAATLAKKTLKPVTGAIASAAGTLLRIDKKFVGGVVPPGATLLKIDKKFVGALTTPSATLVKVDKKLTTSVITPTATMKAAQVKVFTAAVATAGALKKNIFKALAASITSAATVTKTYRKNVFGFLYGPAGSGGAQIIRKVVNYIFDD